MGVIVALGVRLLRGAGALLLGTVLLFGVLRVLPDDVATMAVGPGAEAAELAAERARLGLDLWLPQQFGLWLWQMLSGDWGVSAQLGVPVARLLRAAVPATLELAGLAMLVCVAAGLAGGLALFVLRRAGGRREGRAALSETGAALMLSVPVLTWVLGLVLVFGLALELLPAGGRLAPGVAWPVRGGTGVLLLDALLAGDAAAFGSALAHLALPAAALGLGFAPPVMRVLGAGLAAAQEAPFAVQARLRGRSGAAVLWREAMPVAALPALAVLGRQFGLLLGGAAVVEAVCFYPGLGRLLVEAVRAADLPVLQAAGLVFAVLAVLGEAMAEGLGRGLGPGSRP